MTRNKKILIGGIALAAIAAGALAASAARGGFGHHGGRMGGMGGGMMGAVCRGDAAEMADHMLVRIEHKVKPTDAQKPAFDELKTAAKAAAAKAKAGCPAAPVQAADGTRPAPKPPTERLAAMEAALAAQLDAVRTVRPAAEKFYASLTQEQKQAFAERERGGVRGMHRGGGDGEGRGMHYRGHGGGRGDRGGEGMGDMTPPAAAPDKR
ncbi:MAG: Spy/CpxP family protein refolding chaperone [Hyphomicrobiaceae bacterium]